MVKVHHGSKIRPGVVLRVDDDAVLLVITGTSVERAHIPCVSVEPFTRAGKALGLTTTTYFNQYCIVQIEQIHAVAGRCPPDVFLALREFFEAHLAPETE